MLNVLELQKNLYFETAFSIVSAYAEHLITLVAVHQWQPVPIFMFRLKRCEVLDVKRLPSSYNVNVI